ncbi:MAG: hypothetical protein Q8R35_00395 [bacterium]|nr:hypothetical protein [bacterium]
MSKFYGFGLWLCGIIWLSLALPIVGSVFQRDSILGTLFIAPGLVLFFGGALLLSVSFHKVE